MRASQVFRYRTVQSGVTVEMVIWALPRASAERPHGLKYRLYCGRGGRCIVRYDNEAGKGDHRHYGGRETGYRFTDPDRLIADFQRDIARWNHENRDS